MPVLTTINYDPAVQKADLHNRAVFEAGGELVRNLREAKNELMSLIDGKK
jgi:hypothetical protein